ncbi:MAG: CHAT domain-containing protein [Sphingobacteriaceae bacterium]|nr:CHAT domain-containing protein [Sphingobacteriaceae bacterium]
MSLWPVDDNATQLLMVKFYEFWLKDATNQNIFGAFKKAQLDVKQKFPHPYYWGAFVLLKELVFSFLGSIPPERLEGWHPDRSVGETGRESLN